jgi:hypothetical protein
MNTTIEKPRATYRKTAIIVGILFIIGTAAGILSVVTTQSVSNAEDYYAAVMANESLVIIGALFILVMGLSLAMIPVVLFPLLKIFNEVLALGYVVFRGVLETVTYIGMTVCMLLLVPFAQGYAEASDAYDYQNLATVVMQVQDAINIMLIIMFSLGGLILYYLLFKSKLIPRWLSVWGIIGILLHLSTAFLDMFGIMDSSMSGGTMTLNFPIFLQEMVMAVWLIVKGFSIKPSENATVTLDR